MKTSHRPTPRPYRMRERALSTAATRRRIISAVLELHRELFFDELTLAVIAERADVTVQTVLHHFGSKDALFDAVREEALEQVASQRDEAPVGDIPAAVRNLIEHYEEWGDGVLRLLAQEERLPAVREITDAGRAYHRTWTERTFAPILAKKRGRPRARRLAQLVVATDVYAWKLLRRDLGLSRAETETAVRELVTALEGRPT